MGGVSSDFVSKSLRLDNTHVIDDSLVDMEVISQPRKRDKLISISFEEDSDSSPDHQIQIGMNTYFP